MLDELLRRPGLDVPDRLLVCLATAVWPGDTPSIDACARHYQALRLPRADLEEVLLQSILFCGFPRVINAFHTLESAWPAAAPPQGGAVPASEQRAAGESLFATIYRDNAPTVQEMLRGFHGELHEFVMDTAYGRILSRPGLQPRQRELMALGVLAHTGQVPQLIAHGRGALRCGATPVQVQEAIFTGREDAEFAAKMLRRIGPPDKAG